MIAARRARQRHWLLFAHATRALRRHFLSLLSLAIIIVALAVTLTTASIKDADTAPEAPALAQPEVPFPGSGPETAVVVPRVTYYLYDEPSQREAIETAMRGDGSYFQRRNILTDFGDVFFLEATPETAALLGILAYEIAPAAPSKGYEVVIVDLRP
jgi:hypothetical protein